MYLNFAFWNIENFFNPETGGPRGDLVPENGWTQKQLIAKGKRLSNAINNFFADGIDILGICEVDDFEVLEQWLESAWNSKEFAFVAVQAENSYNLDTALIYRKSRFRVMKSESKTILTRHPKTDVLWVDLWDNLAQRPIGVIINHWTSRVLGEAFSSSFRCTTAENLQASICKKLREDNDYPLIIAGDFNDDPFSPSMMNHLLATFDKNAVIRQDYTDRSLLYNPCWNIFNNDIPGTLYHEKARASKWRIFDQILLSKGALNNSKWGLVENSLKVFTKDTSNADGKPFSSFYWDEDDRLHVVEGYSDHFPIGLSLHVR